MTVDTEPQAENEVMDATIEQAEQNAPAEAMDDQQPQEAEDIQEETQVPLSALQKERKKRQEMEMKYQRYEIENQYLKEQYSRKEEPEDDDSLYESVTKAELKQAKAELDKSSQQTRAEIMRDVEENIWKKANAEKAEYVDTNLEQFLAKRPNLVSAIKDSGNRYEEAYLLMSALSPRQRKEMSQPHKKASPGSPSAVPKAAALSQAVDVMSMSDEEFSAWRNSKRRR